MKIGEIGDALSIIRMENFKALITLKSGKSKPFVAKVQDFNYDEDDTKVVLTKCEESVFPGKTEENTLSLYLKDIKNVDRYR